MMNKETWHYDLIDQYSKEYYSNVITISDIDGDEMAIKKKKNNKEDPDEYEFFYECRKDKIVYLLPSDFLTKLPFNPVNVVKFPFKNKAYTRIISGHTKGIKPEQTMSYKEMIDNWLDLNHERKDLLTLHKIIVDCAVCQRINVRIITYPSWMKNSPVTTLSGLRSDVVEINNPSLAKLKYLLASKPKLILLDEMQDMKVDDLYDAGKFYEAVGAGSPEYVNPKRKTGGSLEKFNISELSTITCYNFPDYSKGETNSTIFDWIFKPKVKSRIFPLLYEGGNQSDSACKESFVVVRKITKEEIDQITKWRRAQRYYETEFTKGSERYKIKHKLTNNRWEINYKTILSRVDMYCDSQEEFDKFEELLYSAHKKYLDFINKEEWIVEKPEVVKI